VKRKHPYQLVAALLLLMAMLAGCLARSAGTYSVDDVVAALKRYGLEAGATGERVDGGPFGVQGAVVKVGQETMQVYVYKNKEDQEAVRISQDGRSVENKGQVAMVTWIAQPHFARKGNVLVTFATNDTALAGRVAAAVQSME
jgi:hypothetical protein